MDGLFSELKELGAFEVPDRLKRGTKKFQKLENNAIFREIWL